MARLIGILEAAELLSTSESHLRRLVYERRITFVKVGGKLRFREDDLLDWLDEQTFPAQR